MTSIYPLNCWGKLCVFGTQWWNFRFAGNHILIELAVIIFSIYLFVRKGNVTKQLALIFAFLVITDLFTNLGHAFQAGLVQDNSLWVGFIKYGPWLTSDGVLLPMTALLVTLYLRKWELAGYAICLLPYLIWWWSIGFPTSMASIINQVNFGINFVEIVYWLMAIALYWFWMIYILGKREYAPVTNQTS